MSEIITDATKRWEQGIPHHPESKRIFDILQEADEKYCNNYFDWKSGGDGDNGETLMYALDIYFELHEAKKKARECEQEMPQM